MRDLAALLNGPQTIGRGPVFWTAAVLVLIAAAIYPQYAERFAIANTAYFGVWVFMALGLGLIWGYGGTLSFGQTAFFGAGRLRVRRHRDQSRRRAFLPVPRPGLRPGHRHGRGNACLATS